MAEEIEDTAFYREDFSTESDWEVFHAQLRELFNDFELNNNWGREFEQNELYTCEWKVRVEKLELLKKQFVVKYYIADLEDSNSTPETEPSTPTSLPRPMQTDLLSSKNTFASTISRQTNGNLHPIACYYGLRRFVLIHPETKYFTNPAEFSFFFSAAIVAATEAYSTVPVFVQIFDPKWNYFLGVGVGSSLRTNFDVVAMEQSPPDWRYLSGLLAIFHEKIGEQYSATVSVRMTYMQETSIRIPGHIPFSKNLGGNEQHSNAFALSTSQFVALPHGFLPDSHTELYAAYSWEDIAENIAMDSALLSDFTPLNAQQATIYQITNASSYLSSCLLDFLKLRNSTQTLEAFLGRNFSDANSAIDAPNPLDQLSQHKLLSRKHRDSRINMQAMGKQLKKIPGPMNEFELDQMLLYLFPDIQPEGALWPYSEKKEKQEFDPQQIKSALPDSLVCRLSCLLANCHAHFGGMAGLSQLWAAFIRELRLLWDNGLMVPSIATGFPDTRTCLLQQKLQMLNVCVERRRQREFGITIDPERSELHAIQIAKRNAAADDDIEKVENVDNDDDEDKHVTKGVGIGDEDAAETETETEAEDGSKIEDDDDNDDDDEFYDCVEDVPTVNANKREGRLKRLGNLKLLDSDESIYVPVTQEPVPKTEDQLHEDAEAMLKLGPGSGLTTQMMCSSLRSDMEAFKAANPKAKMEDFIRWYSPKDWEEITDDMGNKTQRLSPRMTAPDNTWLTVWNQANPVPAWRQKRLFDDTNEALKVLHYLETRTIGDIYELTIIPVLHSAVLKLKDILNQCEILEIFNTRIDKLLTELCRLSRNVEVISETETSIVTQLPNPTSFIKQLESLETQLYQYKCFELMAGYPNQSNLNEIKRKFKETLDGNCKMATRKQLQTAGAGDVDNCLFGYSENGDLNLNLRHELHDNLISKEYVIRVHSEENAGKEQNGPQFLRAIVTGERLRLCGAFTENTTFIQYD